MASHPRPGQGLLCAPWGLRDTLWPPLPLWPLRLRVHAQPYLDMAGLGAGQGRQGEAPPETYPLGRHAGPRGMPAASPRVLLPHPPIWGHNTNPS